MTSAERKELAHQLSTAIRAGDLREVQRLLDIADGNSPTTRRDDAPAQPNQRGDEQPEAESSR